MHMTSLTVKLVRREVSLLAEKTSTATDQIILIHRLEHRVPKMTTYSYNTELRIESFRTKGAAIFLENIGYIGKDTRRHAPLQQRTLTYLVAAGSHYLKVKHSMGKSEQKLINFIMKRTPYTLINTCFFR